jgi:hypothetical protein
MIFEFFSFNVKWNLYHDDQSERISCMKDYVVDCFLGIIDMRQTGFDGKENRCFCL